MIYGKKRKDFIDTFDSIQKRYLIANKYFYDLIEEYNNSCDDNRYKIEFFRGGRDEKNITGVSNYGVSNNLAMWINHGLSEGHYTWEMLDPEMYQESIKKLVDKTIASHVEIIQRNIDIKNKEEYDLYLKLKEKFDSNN